MTDQSDAMLNAAMMHVPFDGWSETSFTAAASDAGIPMAEARALSLDALDLEPANPFALSVATHVAVRQGRIPSAAEMVMGNVGTAFTDALTGTTNQTTDPTTNRTASQTAKGQLQ